jgi:hypothetical protein
VWVDAGCRAEFEVDFPNQRHQQRNAPQQDQGDEDNDEERGQNEGGDRRDERDSRYEQRDHDQASGDRHAGPTDFITCESIDRQRRYCEVGHPVAVRLDRQLSDAACVRGQSWQETPTGVWVAHGCRAVFRIH